ncbi:MAG: lytic transglycosylase domain-containing protein [Geminicoccaceae bacterium]|nr:MAG: lytic transglycosylase domain-containing protein [Geminicoccaceae bacterium]
MSTLRQATRFALLVLLVTPALPAAASPCDDAIRVVEREYDMPQGLLRAIGLVESGRTTAAGYAPWPWTVNSPEGGVYLESHAAAVARVEALRARGHTNIDVGCMQINLRHHPNAFASLDEALRPAANVRYAARFLAALKRETGSWQSAIGRYHSATPNLATAYRQRVADRWDTAPPAASSPPATTTTPPTTAPLFAAALPPPQTVRAGVPDVPRGAVAVASVRVSDEAPRRAGPGAIAGIARPAQPVLFTRAPSSTPAPAPGALRSR